MTQAADGGAGCAGISRLGIVDVVNTIQGRNQLCAMLKEVHPQIGTIAEKVDEVATKVRNKAS